MKSYNIDEIRKEYKPLLDEYLHKFEEVFPNAPAYMKDFYQSNFGQALENLAQLSAMTLVSFKITIE